LVDYIKCIVSVLHALLPQERKIMEISGLGKVTKHAGVDEWYQSEPMSVPVLGGKICRIVVERYDEDPKKDEFHAAITNFLSISPAVLKEAELHIFQYYKEVFDNLDLDEDEEYVTIESSSGVWTHIRLGSEPMVQRRGYGDEAIYVSLECGCDWEEEHGLQIVFKNGLYVNKVGPFDGHVTNSDAYADDSLDDVIYRSSA
jgi:hypothetical protein